MTHTSDSVKRVFRPSWIGRLAYHVLPFRRAVVLSNLRTVFGDRLDPGEIRALAQCFYQHILRLCFETFVMSWVPKSSLRDRVRIEGDRHLREASDQGKGVLLLTGHFGNWELVPVAAMLHFPELKGRFHVLRRLLVNKFVERVLFGRFSAAGLDVIPKRGSLGRVLDALARNEIVAFIMDQHAKPGKDGVVVDFFGRKAGTFKSLAVIARSTGSPVVPAYCYREKGGHVMRFLEPVRWIERADPDEEIAVNTLEYNRVLERIVLEHPEQWYWIHRRWKIR